MIVCAVKNLFMITGEGLKPQTPLAYSTLLLSMVVNVLRWSHSVCKSAWRCDDVFWILIPVLLLAAATKVVYILCSNVS